MKNVLILCTGNSCRSQILHGFLQHFAPGKFNYYSAGIETHGINKDAIKYMKEENIDISHHTSNLISEYEHITFDYVLTVCDHASEKCPIFPAKTKVIHQNFKDPSKVSDLEKLPSSFRICIDEIKLFSLKFLKEFK